MRVEKRDQRYDVREADEARRVPECRSRWRRGRRRRGVGEEEERVGAGNVREGGGVRSHPTASAEREGEGGGGGGSGGRAGSSCRGCSFTGELRFWDCFGVNTDGGRGQQ